MARDLRRWIKEVENLGLLKHVSGADWNHEIGAITDLNAKRKKHTLLFDEIKGYPRGHRVLTGALLDAKRVSLSLGLATTEKDVELVSALRKKLSAASSSAADFQPEYVSDAPLMQNVQKENEIDLLAFPSCKWYEADGGRYLGTADAVITKDRNAEWVNVGTYRVMIRDRKTLNVFMEASRHGRFHMQSYFDKSEPCPVIISFGHHPAISLFGGTEVPHGVSEFNYIGAVTGERYRVVKGPITGLPIPADSELAIEGQIVNEYTDEGPFGEFMGYYGGGVTKAPVIQVKAVYYRDEPIILGTCSGRPPYDYSYFRCPIRAALIWDILEKAGISNVQGVWCHEAGFSRAFTVVSIKQGFAGHARQAGYVACQCRPGAISGRYVVVVDEDIDPSNINEVVWAMCSRSDPATGIEVIRETVGTSLDPLATHSPDKSILEYSSSRGIIFATKPFSKIIHGTFPRVVEPSKDLKDRVQTKWSDILS